MQQNIGGGWFITDEGPGASADAPTYLAQRCRHGRHIAHDFGEALRCGMLKDVAHSREHTLHDAAAATGAHWNTVARWWRGEQCPRGLYRRAVQAYLAPHWPG